MGNERLAEAILAADELDVQREEAIRDIIVEPPCKPKECLAALDCGDVKIRSLANVARKKEARYYIGDPEGPGKRNDWVINVIPSDTKDAELRLARACALAWYALTSKQASDWLEAEKILGDLEKEPAPLGAVASENLAAVRRARRATERKAG